MHVGALGAHCVLNTSLERVRGDRRRGACVTRWMSGCVVVRNVEVDLHCRVWQDISEARLRGGLALALCADSDDAISED